MVRVLFLSLFVLFDFIIRSSLRLGVIVLVWNALLLVACSFA